MDRPREGTEGPGAPAPFRGAPDGRPSDPDPLNPLQRLADPMEWIAVIVTALLMGLALTWACVSRVDLTVRGPGVLVFERGETLVSAPGRGRLTAFSVRVGDKVLKGQRLGVIVPDPERHSRGAAVSGPSAASPAPQGTEMPSPCDGAIYQVYAREGACVAAGGPVAVIEPDRLDVRHLEARVLLSARDGGRIRAGMSALVTPDGACAEEHGHILGSVAPVGALPLPAERLQRLLGNRVLAEKLGSRGAAMEICVTLERHGSEPGSYRWTLPGGAAEKLSEGQGVEVAIVIRSVRPIELLLPALKDVFGP